MKKSQCELIDKCKANNDYKETEECFFMPSKSYQYNWKIKIDNNKILDVEVEALFEGKFCKKELKRIQNCYNEKNKKINFEEKVKIDDICYKYRTKLVASWNTKAKESEETLGFIMFNPSFANPKNSDDTARNAIKFAQKNGCNKIVIFNLFPIRISRADIVRSYYSNEFLEKYECAINIEDLPNKVVLCWGKLPQKMHNIDLIIEKLYKNLQENHKCLYQITDEIFQRHLSSSSINSIGGIRGLNLSNIESIYKFNK